MHWVSGEISLRTASLGAPSRDWPTDEMSRNRPPVMEGIRDGEEGSFRMGERRRAAQCRPQRRLIDKGSCVRHVRPGWKSLGSSDSGAAGNSARPARSRGARPLDLMSIHRGARCRGSRTDAFRRGGRRWIRHPGQRFGDPRRHRSAYALVASRYDASRARKPRTRHTRTRFVGVVALDRIAIARCQQCQGGSDDPSGGHAQMATR